MCLRGKQGGPDGEGFLFLSPRVIWYLREQVKTGGKQYLDCTRCAWTHSSFPSCGPGTNHVPFYRWGNLRLRAQDHRASVKNQITGVPAHQHTLLTEGQLPELFGKRPLFTPEGTLLGNAPNRNKPETPTKIPTWQRTQRTKLPHCWARQRRNSRFTIRAAEKPALLANWPGMRVGPSALPMASLKCVHRGFSL